MIQAVISNSTRRRRWILPLLSIATLVLISLGSSFHLVSEAFTSRSVNLTQGINFSHWFFIPAEGDRITKSYLEKWINEADVQSVVRLGFKHIRLPVDPDALQPGWRRGNFQIDDLRLQYLDRAIDAIQKNQLTLILDIHPTRKLDLAAGTASPDYKRLSDLWSVLSQRYNGSSRRIVYEILNEPQTENAALWRSIAQQLINEIRQRDPSHHIIVPGSGLSGVYDLQEMQPLQGDRLIYTFHFYTPLQFTHQGASWVEHHRDLLNIPYPVAAASLPQAPPAGGSQWSTETLKLWKEYQKLPANREGLRAEIELAKQWSDQYQVPIYCGEYGVHDLAPKDDRYRWHADVTSVLKEVGIGGAVWSYRGNFGVIPDGQTEPDLNLIQALNVQT